MRLEDIMSWHNQPSGFGRNGCEKNEVNFNPFSQFSSFKNIIT